MNLLVKCKQCGNENPVGDLFCRHCGAEIDLNNLDPKQFKKEKKTGRLAKFIDTVCSLLVFFGLVFSIMLLIPGPSIEINDPTPEELKVAEGAGGEIELALKGESPKPANDQEKPKPPMTHFLVNQKEAGRIFKFMFLKNEKYTKANCAVNVDGEANVTAVLKNLVYGFPFKIIIKGKLEATGTEDLLHWRLAQNSNLAINYTQVGLIPLGPQAAPLIRKFFMQFMEEETFKTAVTKVDAIKITKEKLQLSIYLAKPEEPGKTQ